MISYSEWNYNGEKWREKILEILKTVFVLELFFFKISKISFFNVGMIFLFRVDCGYQNMKKNFGNFGNRFFLRIVFF